MNDKFEMRSLTSDLQKPIKTKKEILKRINNIVKSLKFRPEFRHESDDLLLKPYYKMGY